MKQEKQLLLDEIINQLKGSESFIIAQYTKIDANKTNIFRREMVKVGGNFEVVKKRVFLKALAQVGVSMQLSTLPGHIGLIFAGQDPIETTKAIVKFSKANENAFNLVGGKVDGQLIEAKDMERLSNLPSKDQMRASLLGLMEAPMSATLSVIEAVLSSVVYCLDNKAKSE
ncbi:MAG: rplJ [Chlamydiia bacterium]|nr:rplJ [Chlamydiia bacterium]